MGAMECGRDGVERWDSHRPATRTRVQARGQFRDTTSMGAMEWGVTGGSVPTAAASQETRHRVTRALGQFLDTSSMGAMEWGVTGGSVPPAAASEETRHRVARARGQFRERSSMGAMEWGGAMPHVVGLVVVDVASIKVNDRAGVNVHAASLRARGTLPGNCFHGGHGMGRGRGSHSSRWPCCRGCYSH